jgi:hypothetical protein
MVFMKILDGNFAAGLPLPKAQVFIDPAHKYSYRIKDGQPQILRLRSG